MKQNDITKGFHEISSAVPCGTVEFECEENLKITGISDSMLGMLKYSKVSEDALEICRQNIYMIIAPQDRTRFASIVSDAAVKPQNGPQKIDLVCFDGNTVSCLFWLEKVDKRFRATFIEVSSWLKKERIEETEKYVKILSEIYSDIFEFDYTSRTVKAVYSKRSAMLRWIKDVPMQMEEATKKWILHKVPAEDIEKLRKFWAEDPSHRISSEPKTGNENSLHNSSAAVKPHKSARNDRLQIHYHVMSSDGTVWRYLGVFIPGGGNTWLFCCRKDPEYIEAASEPYNGPKVKIRTFGYFDVFIGDTPVAFRNEKSKELLALLVDRKGGYVTADEAISFLWEDSPADALTLSRYRKVALRLKRTLEEYGISEIIESVNGKRRIVTDRVQCDLYDYLTGKEEFAGLFKGSYLTNYSWAENTLAELL